MIRNLEIGNKGENVATEFLLQKDYVIVERNWRFKNYEVDIICSKNNKLHFVEVKTRTSNKFGHPEESINQTKMNALKKAAEQYLLQNEQWTLIQFDVVAITFKKDIIEEIFFIEDVFF